MIDDDLWSAIGDPTRRTMLDLLLAGGAGTATSLSAQLPVTRQAVAKHLAVLDRVGLVHASPVGRERHYLTQLWLSATTRCGRPSRMRFASSTSTNVPPALPPLPATMSGTSLTPDLASIPLVSSPPVPESSHDAG